ncbi:MAG: hypothetical protein CME62_02545 [Halobacteriovoraceae bacterium]|nr:hypothetical protein [Halobacteriovoraceae bacterium]|tara:strand:+ start:3698 stop:3931 length:234 start_codon:yes stop_codon:yes gene_type:complete
MSLLPENIFLISQPLRRARAKNEFHFTGYYQGRKIRKIIVKGAKFDAFKIYMLELRTLSIEKDTLYTQLVKFKHILD